MVNLDTHIILHAAARSLTREERDILSSDTWGISAIVLWEIAKLSQKGRVDFDLTHPDVKRALGAVHIFPITPEIAHLSTELDFEGDPADELIAATSVHHRVPLLTRDATIRRSKMVTFAG